MSIEKGRIAAAVWSHGSRTRQTGTAATPDTRAQQIAKAVWEYSSRSLATPINTLTTSRYKPLHPNIVPRLKKGHPLARNLVICGVHINGRWHELSCGHDSGPGSFLSAHPRGSLVPTSYSTKTITFNRAGTYEPQLTVFASGYAPKGTPGFGSFGGNWFCGIGGSGSTPYFMNWYSGQLRFNGNQGSLAFDGYGPFSVAITNNRPNSASGGVVKGYANGTLIGTLTNEFGINGDRFVTSWDDTTVPNAVVLSLQMAWTRVLTDSELEMLSRDPYQMFDFGVRREVFSAAKPLAPPAMPTQTWIGHLAPRRVQHRARPISRTPLPNLSAPILRGIKMFEGRWLNDVFKFDGTIEPLILPTGSAGSLGGYAYTANAKSRDGVIVPNLAKDGRLSISCWVRTTSVTGQDIYDPYFAIGHNDTIYASFISLGRGGINYAYAQIGQSYTVAAAQGATVINDGNWHLLTAVVDPTHLYLYVDGKQDATPVAHGLSITAISNYSWELAANGAVAAPMAWERNLSAAEVRQLWDPQSRWGMYAGGYARTPYVRPYSLESVYLTAYPSGVFSAGGWTAVGAGSIPAALADADDNTLARSSQDASSDPLVLTFDAMNTPGDGNVTFTIRHRKTP